VVNLRTSVFPANRVSRCLRFRQTVFLRTKDCPQTIRWAGTYTQVQIEITSAVTHESSLKNTNYSTQNARNCSNYLDNNS